MNKIMHVILVLLVMVGLLLFGSGLPLAGGDSGQGKSLGEARKALEKEILSVPGFAGIAHVEQAGEIVVFLENQQAHGIVDDVYEDFPVRKEVTGIFQARSAIVAEPAPMNFANEISPERKAAVRPLVGGTSVSAYVAGQSWAGTLGMITYDNKILSNAHVIALDLNNNFLTKGIAPIIQPGSLDGGSSANQVGILEKYIPITFSNNTNDKNPVVHYADAAIATLSVEGLSGWQFSEAGDYQISGTTTVVAGDTVRKSGRTTGLTVSSVNITNASVWVQYGTNKYAYYQDQIAINQSFSGSGDSGSAVDKDGSFVGLVFAGGDIYSIVCKASYIISGLGIAVEPAGYTFNAPPVIDLGNMAPGMTITGSSTGSLTGSSTGGYTITGIDTKTVNTGHMVSGSYTLSNMLQIGPAADSLGPADVEQTFLDVGTSGTYSVPLHISQYIDYTDAAVEDYNITITFTVTEK